MGFPGVRWMTRLSESMWGAGGGDRPWAELYGPLTKLLFEIGFVGIVRVSNGRASYMYDDQTLADRADALNTGRFFRVHHTFRAALGIRPARLRKEEAQANVLQ
jgi:hypothetical protein